MTHRSVARRTPEEWQDAFYSLEERHRQLQKTLNAREQELKLLKVAQRRFSAAPRLATSGAEKVAGREKDVRAPVTTATTGTTPTTAAAAAAEHFERDAEHEARRERDFGVVSVPSAARRNDAGAAAVELSGAWSAAPVPDPSMVWGMENSIQNYVTANALYHTNEELRRRLEDAVGLVKTLQHELASSRSLVTATEKKLEDATQKVHQLVRERDLASQRLTVSQQAVADLERSLKTRTTEEERIRFGLESQITELRSRLVVGADSNELLSRDVRSLLSEVKEKSSEVQALRSKLALAEAALSSQKHNNENLLVELHSLNNQLVNERKRLLAMMREAQLASLRADDAKDVEARLADAVASHSTLEREHVRLMESLVGVTESALRQAREEVRQDLADWRASAAHWESVSQLLYKDITQRTQAHIQCREECEEAKRERDEASIALRDAWEELKLCRAKLDIVWPTHRTDTHDLTPAEILATFGNYRAIFKQRKQLPSTRGDEKYDVYGKGADDGEIVVELCDAPPEEQISELQEANSALLAEIEQLRIANALQSERLRMMEGNVRRERETIQASEQALERREKAAHSFLQTQLDRVSFLEAQVRSLRGYDVSPSMSLSELGSDETVFELFLGQILSTDTPEGLKIRDTFPHIFCSVDFLLHETVTTPIVTGLNTFVDTTLSFRVAMDALLQRYLQSRELLVQLHRVRFQDEIDEIISAQGSDPESPVFAERLYATLAEGSVSLWPFLADEQLRNAQRPTLRGHIPLRTPNGHHIASVEFTVTVRTPFSETFRMLSAEAAKQRGPEMSAATRRVEAATAAAAAMPRSQERLPEVDVKRSEGKMQLVPTTENANVFRSASTTSSSKSLLELSVRDRPSGFTLVPRTAVTAGIPSSSSNMFSTTSSSSSSLAVNSLIVDVCRLHLPRNLTPLPRLSCYYALKPLDRDVYLPPPPTARYEFEYLQEGGSGGTVFSIASLRQLLAVTREPFMLFFFDESAAASGGHRSQSAGQYWAMAMAEWRFALERPEEYVLLELPLMDQQGSPVHGAFVRVRLLATSKIHTAEGESLAATPARALFTTESSRQESRQRRHERGGQERSPFEYHGPRAGGGGGGYSALSENQNVCDTTGILRANNNNNNNMCSLDLEIMRRQLGE